MRRRGVCCTLIFVDEFIFDKRGVYEYNNPSLKPKTSFSPQKIRKRYRDGRLERK